MSEPADLVRTAAVRIAALAQDGLTFALGDPAKDYDAARYRELTELAADLLAAVSTSPREVLRALLDTDAGYATPKVDVRAGVIDDQVGSCCCASAATGSGRCRGLGGPG